MWRIYPDGHPEKVFSAAQDVIYSIAFDGAGHALLGSGNKGTLYRVDTPSRYTSLITLASNQITALQTTRDGAVLACTGNVGKVFQFGPQMEKTGTIESDVFDAGAYSGEYVVTDTGQKIIGRHIDLRLPSPAAAKRFGKRTVWIHVVKWGDGQVGSVGTADRRVSRR